MSAQISIVVPVFHNAASLDALLSEFKKLAAQNPEESFEFIFVDDGSKDESLSVLQELAQEEARMRVIKLSRNFGSNAAILAGMMHAQGDAIAAIAADLQDPPELLHEMIQAWRNGRKVVLAARRERHDPGLTNLIADIFYMLFRRFVIKSMPERGFDFFLIDRQVNELIINIQENNAYLMGLILWMGFDPMVIYYTRRAREERYGTSMWTLAKKIKYFIDSFVAFSYLPIRLASLIGLLISIAGVIYAVLIIILSITTDFKTQGWASTMLVILLTSGIQMVILGILGEYLWRNLDETRKRPRFIIDYSFQHKNEVD